MSTVATANGRNGVIDTAKCLLIFGIFVFHYGTSAGRLYGFFGDFHVPAFFMVSGFWALNRTDRSVWQFVCQAVKKYLLLWFVWVLVYTAYFSVLHQYSPRLIWEIFLRYFLAVRGSGIAGMWFVPAFFLVTFAYFLLAKAVAKVLPKSKIGQAALLCGISFVIYFWFDYVWAYSGGLWFSLHQVPVHLFYYSLGTLFYAVWQRPMTPACKNGLTWLGGGIAVAYCVLMLWQWDEQLWQFTQEIWFPYLTVIPITLAAVAGLFGTLMVARAIQCKFLIRLGKATLGLCLCEFFMKHVVNGVLSILGIMPTVTPLIALAFSLAFLVVGGFWVVPAMDWVIKKLLSLWEKGTRNRNTVSSQ